MIKILNRLILLLLILGISSAVLALDFDASFDEEVRKNYNPSKLELEQLPPLPNVQPSSNESYVPKQTYEEKPLVSKPVVSKPIISNPDSFTSIKIKKGTKFKVRSNQTISDATRKGTRISFVSQKSVMQRYLTIPQGTIFRGEVANSHTPQISGNGGLIVISVDSMVVKGSTVGINAKITKANHRNIFLNNIKGERKYMKSIPDSTKGGKRFYKKMVRTTSKLANGEVSAILSPFPVIAGVTVYGANIIASPLLAVFSKGGRVSIPANSEFEIKLLEDVYLNY